MALTFDTPTRTAQARAALGLDAVVLEELLRAVGDREDVGTAESRALLARGRQALERELALELDQ